ncbi:MAG: hypothetical protein ACFE9L_21005 [Candidatus Hodarchaeota archaeon]
MSKKITEENFEANWLIQAKELTETCLKEILNDFNKYYGEEVRAIRLHVSRISLKILGEDYLQFSDCKSLGADLIESFFIRDIKKEKYHKYYSQLKEFKLLDIENKQIQTSLFGKLVIEYIRILTEYTENEDDEIIFPYQFDQDLFSKFWTGTLSWITQSHVTFNIYYPIFDVKLIGNPIVLHTKENFVLKIPTIQDREALANDLRIRPSAFEGRYKSTARLSWIAYCSGWIEGKIELSFEDLKKVPLKLELATPNFFEEAFLLLGLSNVQVRCLIFNDPFQPEDITIEPISDGKGILTRRIGFKHYPQWMEQYPSPLFNKEKLELNDEIRVFLSIYPELRKNLPQDSLIKLLLTRFVKAIRPRLFNDIILEITIGIESLLTDGEGGVSLQFRLNTSWLIGLNYKERVIIENFCKTLYRIRSKIVHSGGKTVEIDKLVKKTGSIQKTRNLAIDLYRLILLRTIRIDSGGISFIDLKSIVKSVKKAILGGGLDFDENPIFSSMYANFIDKLSNSES